jgi:hypothetical protein
MENDGNVGFSKWGMANQKNAKTLQVPTKIEAKIQNHDKSWVYSPFFQVLGGSRVKIPKCLARWPEAKQPENGSEAEARRWIGEILIGLSIVMLRM